MSGREGLINTYQPLCNQQYSMSSLFINQIPFQFWSSNSLQMVWEKSWHLKIQFYPFEQMALKYYLAGILCEGMLSNILMW